MENCTYKNYYLVNKMLDESEVLNVGFYNKNPLFAKGLRMSIDKKIS